MKTKLFFILPLIALFTFTGCNSDDAVMESQYKRGQGPDFNNKPGDQTIAQIVEDANNATPSEFNALAAAIGYVDSELSAGLGAAISNNDIELTVFAPTDAAFGNLLAALEIALEEDPDFPAEVELELTDIPAPIVLTVVQYHLTNGRRASNSVVPSNSRNNKTVQTLLEGASFEVDKDKVIFATGGNTANIVTPNISASNGVIHKINEVLLPLTVDEVLDLLRPPSNP
jgi:transforming growth factor-beta-induced protein